MQFTSRKLINLCMAIQSAFDVTEVVLSTSYLLVEMCPLLLIILYRFCLSILKSQLYTFCLSGPYLQHFQNVVFIWEQNISKQL